MHLASGAVFAALSVIICGVPTFAASKGPVKLLYNNDLDRMFLFLTN